MSQPDTGAPHHRPDLSVCQPKAYPSPHIFAPPEFESRRHYGNEFEKRSIWTEQRHWKENHSESWHGIHIYLLRLEPPSLTSFNLVNIPPGLLPQEAVFKLSIIFITPRGFSEGGCCITNPTEAFSASAAAGRDPRRDYRQHKRSERAGRYGRRPA